MNKFQKILVDNYCGGDFSTISTSEEAHDIGDSLFTFLFNELSDNEDCEQQEIAVSRLNTAVYDIQTIKNIIEECSND